MKSVIAILICAGILFGALLLLTNKNNLVGVWSDGDETLIEFKRNGDGVMTNTETNEKIRFEWDTEFWNLDIDVQVLWEDVSVLDDAIFFVLGNGGVLFYDGQIVYINQVD